MLGMIQMFVSKIRPMTLFSAGTRNSLCDLDLLNKVLDKLNAPWALENIEGGDHLFDILKSMKLEQKDVYDHVLKKTNA